MTARDAAMRVETSPFPAVALSAGDYVFVLYILPYAPSGQLSEEQLISGVRKDAWHGGEGWEPVPVDDFVMEPLLGMTQKLDGYLEACVPANDEEHRTVLVLNNLI